VTAVEGHAKEEGRQEQWCTWDPTPGSPWLPRRLSKAGSRAADLLRGVASDGYQTSRQGAR